MSAYTYLKDNPNLHDHKNPHRTYLLATSLAVPGNALATYAGEDATFFAYNNCSAFALPPSTILDKYHTSFNNKRTEDMVNRLTRNFQNYIHEQTQRGVLLQLSMPRKYSKHLTYLSFPLGKPICFFAKQTPDVQKRMNRFLTTYRQNAVQTLYEHCGHSYADTLKTLKRLQARVLLHHKAFNAPGIITIQAYHGIPNADLKAYENRLKEIILHNEDHQASHFFDSSLFPEASEEGSGFREKYPIETIRAESKLEANPSPSFLDKVKRAIGLNNDD